MTYPDDLRIQLTEAVSDEEVEIIIEEVLGDIETHLLRCNHLFPEDRFAIENLMLIVREQVFRLSKAPTEVMQ